MKQRHFNAIQEEIVDRISKKAMVPSIGRIVTYYQGDSEVDIVAHFPDGANGTRWHPAIITRVWADDCVNLQVFFDTHGPALRFKILKLPEMLGGVVNPSGNSGWCWPGRVS